MTLRGIIARAGRFFDAFTWIFIAPVYRRLLSGRPPAGITLGITTFKDRYKSCLKPLLIKMHILFPRDQIIIMVNGHYQRKEQEAYLSELKEYCRRFPNTEVESYVDPKGLSFFWNRIIKRARNNNILILNDDIIIKSGFRPFVLQKNFTDAAVAIINLSLSHFKISGKVTETVGLFDEGFREIGGEDDDYLARLALAHIEVKSFITSAIARRNLRTRGNVLNSYGKNMSEERGGYSTVNSDYLESKWEMSTRPFPGAIEVPMRKNRYWKLRPGFEPFPGVSNC
jgi:hypothetical protein